MNVIYTKENHPVLIQKDKNGKLLEYHIYKDNINYFMKLYAKNKYIFVLESSISTIEFRNEEIPRKLLENCFQNIILRC